MKLETKHLAAYLPYELEVFNKFYSNIETLEAINTSGTLFTNNFFKEWLHISKYKPILRPLSQLTQEIKHNGEKFVPAGKMITHGFHNSFWYELDKFDYRYLYAMDLEKLLEWHFDIYGLLENNLAIEKL
jgi:hypothetical protein